MNKKNDFTDTYQEIPINIIVFEKNIRSQYNEEDIDYLAESMKKFGQLQPIRVYEEENDYVVIFGHRRFLAAKKAGINFLNCYINEKPEELDLLYMQAIENEQSESILPIDREKYIKELHEIHKQSVETIAITLGKSEAWIYCCMKAIQAREKFRDSFNNSNIALTTNEASKIANATQEEVDQIINKINENPDSKSEILSSFNTIIRKKKKSGAKPKYPSFNIIFNNGVVDNNDIKTIINKSVFIEPDIKSISDLINNLYKQRMSNNL